MERDGFCAFFWHKFPVPARLSAKASDSSEPGETVVRVSTDPYLEMKVLVGRVISKRSKLG